MATRRFKAKPKKKAVHYAPVDNLLDEGMLRKAIEVELRIKALQEERSRLREEIMEMMDGNAVTQSINDIANVTIVQHERAYIAAGKMKSKHPDLYAQAESCGLVNVAQMRYCMIHPKI